VHVVRTGGSNNFFFELWWIQEGWMVWNSLCSLLLWDGWSYRLETLYSASLSLVDVHIVRAGGSNNFSLSYGGSKRGGECEIACGHFSSEMADHIDLKLCTMLHYH
jgi:hypothetical protein